jgi:phosphinothricin acetyltransferase
MDRARAADIHVMVGAIDGDNQASIRFHESLGFSVVARMPEVGFKVGRRLELVLMQRIIGT